MTRYELIKSVHVLAAAIWAGGSVIAQAHDLRIRLSDPRAVAAAMRDNDAIGYRIFVPASLVAVLAGIALVIDGPYGLEPWVLAGLAVFAASFLVGVLYYGPEGKRVIAAAEAGEDGVGDRKSTRL